jgi:hypothetical protein
LIFFFSFYFLWDYHVLLSNKILQHLIFFKLFFLFYHPIFNWLRIGLQAFFFHFYFDGVISILYMWSHGLQVNSVWLVSIFFYFLSFFFGFYPSTLGCLVTELHNFIQFVFNRITLVSQSGRRFDMLTRMGSCWLFSYRFIVVKFFSSLFIIIAFFFIQII